MINALNITPILMMNGVAFRKKTFSFDIVIAGAVSIRQFDQTLDKVVSR